MTPLTRPSTDAVTIVTNTGPSGDVTVAAVMEHAVFESQVAANPGAAYRDIIKQIAEQLYYYVTFDEEIRGTSFDDHD